MFDEKTLDTDMEEIEKLEALSDLFEQFPEYKSPVSAYSIN